ncbi:MAG: glycosyl hydrolase, partial [Tunicatimonas sp.]
LIREFSTTEEAESKDPLKGKLEVEKGFNRFVWDMHYPGAKTFEGMILWGGGTQGPKAVPGEYQVTLKVGNEQMTQPFSVLADPRWESSPQDIQEQFDFLISARNKLTETHQTIEDIQEVREQMNQVVERVKDEESMSDVVDMAKAIDERITVIEKELYQTKNRSRQDPLNYPIKLNNKLANVASQMSAGNFKPTAQAVAYKEEITQRIDEQLDQFQEVVDQDLPAFNQLVRDKSVNAVQIDPEISELEGTH